MTTATGKVGERHLILGVSGFVGRHVAVMLAQQGHHVILGHRAGIGYIFPPACNHLVTSLHLDLATVDWASVIESIDVIHHYAWSSIPASAMAQPVADLADNVAGTVRLLEAVRRSPRPPRIVFASSGGTVYGCPRHLPVTEDHPLAPITAYGAGKAAAELYLGCYRTLHGLDCRIARIANPFGAGQDVSRGQGAVTVFLDCALAGRPIEIWGDGEVVRDYIHVSDVASGLVQLALAPRNADNWIFNISSGRGLSLNRLVAELERTLGRRINLLRRAPRLFDVPANILDIARARTVLGWSPLLSFAEGLACTVHDLECKTGLSTLDWAHRLGARTTLPMLAE